MNADLSVVPEIARLATPFVPAQPETAVPRTIGRVSGDLSDLAATPERWWDLVRFDPAGPLRIPLPATPGSWLLVTPPDSVAYCDCRYVTLLAGEAVEVSVHNAAHGRPLRPGRVRVYGTRSGHRLRTAGPGYSVTLHAAGTTEPFRGQS